MSRRRHWRAVARLLSRPGQSLAAPPTSVGIVLVMAATAIPLLAGGFDVGAVTGERTLLVAPLAAGSLVGGAATGSRRALSLGAALALAAVAVGGAVRGVPAPNLLLATATVLLALDAGRYGLTVADQLGRDTPAGHLVLAHTAASSAVAGGAVLVGYAAFLTVDGHGSFTAFLLLAVGTAVLATPLLGGQRAS